MKKRNLKSLKLNKHSISNITNTAIKGGNGPAGSIFGGSCFICWPTTVDTK